MSSKENIEEEKKEKDKNEWKGRLQSKITNEIKERKSENPAESMSLPGMWTRMGTLSERASEIFEDAVSITQAKGKWLMENRPKVVGEKDRRNENEKKEEKDERASKVKTLQRTNTPEKIVLTAAAELPTQGPTFAGNLSKRSEWLRRWEKGYYILEEIELKKFSSKEAYDLYQETAEGNRYELPNDKSSPLHTYTVTGAKESDIKQHSFWIHIKQGKPLLVAASNPIEKIIWMRVIAESTTVLPSMVPTYLLPPNVEEFYAMLIVLYTSYTGQWRNMNSAKQDMAVTLPPISEQVFRRFLQFLDPRLLLTSNYPPSVPFCGSFHGRSGFINYMLIFAQHTKWSNFKIEGIFVEGNLAVASGREDLENLKDGRRFTQNWVHKYTFSLDTGCICKMDINADVVAASTVFKAPGAATTLTLPSEMVEIEIEKLKSKSGKVSVTVLQGNGLRFGSNVRKTIKEPWVMLSLGANKDTYGGTTDPNLSRETTTGTNTTTPKLAKKISIRSLRSTVFSSSNTNSSPTDYIGFEHATGPPSNQPINEMNENSNPVWETKIDLEYENLQEMCWLQVQLVDRGMKEAQIVGSTSINLAKYLMESTRRRQKSDASNDGNSSSNRQRKHGGNKFPAKWFTISNPKGEYCGKVLLDILCEPDNDDFNESLERLDLNPSDATEGEISAKPTVAWQRSASTFIEDTSRTTQKLTSRRRAATIDDAKDAAERRQPRSLGWSNLSLSPCERRHKPSRSADHAKRNSRRVLRPHSDTNRANNNNTLSPNSKAVELSSSPREKESIHTFSVCGAPFIIPKRYHLIKVCGRGAYGVVIAATDIQTGRNVAIKKVIDCIGRSQQLKQILREVRLMRHFTHENVLSLMDLIPPPNYYEWRDVYLTVDLMEMDLHRIIYSKEILSDDHIRYFLYQILSGLNHIHKAEVLHRDLKPSNLLINSDCQLKICDFGLARSKETEEHLGMTEYVVTRWYRAPELLLGSKYDEGVDIWAVGCIFAEMLRRKPLLPGRSYVHQLQLIINLLGIPEEHTFYENPQAIKLKGRQLLCRTPSMKGMDLSTLFANANPEASDLLWKMLVFDSEKRISVQDALRHPYVASFYEPEKDERHVEKFSFDFDDISENDLKELMFREICHFHPGEMEKRAKQLASIPQEDRLPPGWIKRESRSIPGKYYYSNAKKGISTWMKPTE